MPEKCVWMAGQVTEWPSNRGPISKIWQSDGCNGDTVPLAVRQWYNFHSVGCHLGNVGVGPFPFPPAGLPAPGERRQLEHFVIIRNREGFPRIELSDSRCGLEKEASPDGEISFD